MTTTTKSGAEMAKEIGAHLMALGATEEQAMRALRHAFARLALGLKSVSPAVEEQALTIACSR